MNTDTIKSRISEILKQPLARLTDDTQLVDLVSDSFALVDLVIQLQEDFDIFLVQQDLKDVGTIGDLLKVIQSRSTLPASA
jgi:acyl carrier protein